MAVETAGFSTAAGSITPVIIGNLEESVVQRSIAVERSDGRRIEVGLPAHQADPFGGTQQTNLNHQWPTKP